MSFLDFLFGSSGSCGECGVSGGSHAGGCPEAGGKNFARGSREWKAAGASARKNARQAAEKYVEDNKRKRFTTYTPGGPGNKRGLPPGTKMTEDWYYDSKGQKTKGYKIVIDPETLP